MRALLALVFLGLSACHVDAHEDRYSASILRWYDGDTPYVAIDMGLGIVLGEQPLRVL